ncbi:DUF5361 domain-containing protein [Streptomyces sparsogenes]|uniref:DUF5361 domain-containing protein n=1 Tax=Streptomyces sparsogenes TaxID=67365 RepID=UPI001FDFE807|nr:DUF5361 domain-containing protein [Streptomyces sparsogenes]
MYRGRLSWRRLRVLIQHLPPESATMTELRNSLSDEEMAEQAEAGEPEKGRWSQVEQLLALIADRVARLEYVTILANSGSKGKKPTPPEPIARPGAKAKRPKSKLSESSAETLFQLINGGAA